MVDGIEKLLHELSFRELSPHSPKKCCFALWTESCSTKIPMLKP